MKCALYRVVHLPSGKDYVGISLNPKRRWAAHWSARRNPRTHFHKALAKHAREEFEWKILAWCSCFSGAQVLERMARHLGFGSYNETLGGEGRLGCKLSQSHKDKLNSAAVAANTGSKRRVGYKHSEQTKAKISSSLRGNPKLSTMAGRKHSAESKLKIGAANKAAHARRRGSQQ